MTVIVTPFYISEHLEKGAQVDCRRLLRQRTLWWARRDGNKQKYTRDRDEEGGVKNGHPVSY